MKLKLILLSALFSVLGVANIWAQDWTWVGETPVSGGKYYLRANLGDGVDRFLNNTTNSFDASPAVLWTIGGTFPSKYTLSSAGGNFVIRKPFASTTVETNSNRTDDDAKLSSSENNGLWEIHRNKTFTFGGNRNIAVSTSGLSTADSPTNCWEFISEAQVEAYNKYIAGETNINMTFAIANPGAETNDGWTFDEGGRYLESNKAHGGKMVFETAGWWSYTTRSVRQTVTNIPNGYYTLSTWRMAGTNATCTLTGNDASATSVGTGDEGDDKWQQMSVITKVTDGNLQIVASSNSPAGVDHTTTWANFDDFSLSYLGNASASMSVNAAAKYGTFCAPFAVTVPSGVEASTATLNENGSTIDLTPVGETIPANTPVILYAESGLSATTLYGAAVNGTPTVGALTGVYTNTPAENGWYVLQNNDNKVGFYKVDTEKATPTVGANRCYLTTGNSNARAFYLGEEEETAVATIEALTTGTSEIYDINGIRTNRLQKGINVVKLANGKTQKVIVK